VRAERGERLAIFIKKNPRREGHREALIVLETAQKQLENTTKKSTGLTGQSGLIVPPRI